jgi:hypothetical protein
MDLSVTETWIDLIIAGIGMLAGLVGIIVGLRYMRMQEVTPPETTVASPAPPPAPLRPIAPSPPAQKAPEVAPASENTPRLSIGAIALVAPNRLRLSLRNDGPTLRYERLEPEAFNELAVTYDPPIFREEERYATGTALTFSLSGPEAARKSYHFQLFFQTLEGEPYRQEVAGVGQEPPILEKPVRL